MEILGSELTTIRIGGLIQCFEQPTSAQALQVVLQQKHKNLKIIGGGSNLIFADEGFRGTVVRPLLMDIQESEADVYSKEIASWRKMEIASGRYSENTKYTQEKDVEGEIVLLEVGSGVIWAKLVAYCLSNRLAGLEVYARIPCRVGGAVRNNIHAGSELLSRHVVAVESLNTNGITTLYNQNSLEFGYDTSRFLTQPECITRAIFGLKRVSAEHSLENTEQYRSIIQRKTTQQPSGPNCGSVFQNLVADGDKPVSAAWYIEQAGCKGIQRGGLGVSCVHANFIVNNGNGTQEDFLELVKTVQGCVYKKFNLELTPEVEVIDQEGRSRWD